MPAARVCRLHRGPILRLSCLLLWKGRGLCNPAGDPRATLLATQLGWHVLACASSPGGCTKQACGFRDKIKVRWWGPMMPCWTGAVPTSSSVHTDHVLDVQCVVTSGQQSHHAP